MNYYARLNEMNKPFILYRATPDMGEQVWVPNEGWLSAEFLIDVIDGSGDIYYIGEEMAKEVFPSEAF